MKIILTDYDDSEYTIFRSYHLDREFNEKAVNKLHSIYCKRITVIPNTNKLVKFMQPFVPILQGKLAKINITELEIRNNDFKMTLCNDLYSILAHSSSTVKLLCIRDVHFLRNTTDGPECDLYSTFRRLNCLINLTNIQLWNCRKCVHILGFISLLDKTPNSIQSLTLIDCDLTENDMLGLKVFIETSPNCHLTELVVRDSSISNCWLLLLCQNIHLTKLKHVDIFNHLPPYSSDSRCYNSIIHSIERRIFCHVESFTIGGIVLNIDQLNKTFENVIKCGKQITLKQLNIRNVVISDYIFEFFIRECPKLPFNILFDDCTVNQSMVSTMLLMDHDKYRFSNLVFETGETDALHKLNKQIAKLMIEDKNFKFGISKHHGSRMFTFVKNYSRWNRTIEKFIFAYIAACEEYTTRLSKDYLFILLEYMYSISSIKMPSY